MISDCLKRSIETSVEKLLAILTGKDAILKVVLNCVLRNDEERLKDLSPYIDSLRLDMSVKHGCFCLEEWISIPKAIKDAVIEGILSIHPGSFAKLLLAQNVCWPYVQRGYTSKSW